MERDIDSMIDSLEPSPSEEGDLLKDDGPGHDQDRNAGNDEKKEEPRDERAKDSKSQDKDEQAEKPKETLEDRLKRLESDLETEKKRRSDTFRDFTETREKNKELERQVAEAKSQAQKVAKSQDDEAFAAQLRKDIEEDPGEGTIKAIRAIRSELAKRKAPEFSDDRLRRYVDEAVFSAQHEDYSKVLEVVLPYLKSGDTPEYKEWQEKGGNARAAYDIGQRIQEANEFRKDPEAFKKRWLDQQKENGESRSDKLTLSDLNSQAAPPKRAYPEFDSIDAALKDALK